MSFSVLGQVESCNFFRLLNLLLVVLIFCCNLVAKSDILSWFFFSSSCWNWSSFRRRSHLVGLVRLRGSRLCCSQFSLQLTNPALHSGNSIFATFSSHIVSLFQSLVKFANLSIKSPLGLFLARSMVLLTSQLIGQTGCIHHGLLGFFFRVFSLMYHVINLSLCGMNSSFHSPFVRVGLGVDVSHVIDGTSCITKFHVSLLFASICGIKQSPSFLQLTGQSIGTPVSKSSFFRKLLPMTAFLFKGLFNIPKLGLIPFDGLMCLSIGLITVVQGNLKFVDI